MDQCASNEGRSTPTVSRKQNAHIQGMLFTLPVGIIFVFLSPQVNIERMTGFLKSLSQILSFLEACAPYGIHVTLCNLLPINVLLMSIFRFCQWWITTSRVYDEHFDHYLCLHNYFNEKLGETEPEPA